MGEISGWISALTFAICAIPQAVQCYKQGHGDGISMAFLWVWFTGEITGIIAVPLTLGWVPWLLVNYIGNTTALLVIMRYRFFPRRRYETQ
jgi:uncharacterized protein with PQ loop repeat